MFAVEAQLAEVFAVVGRENDDGLVIDPCGFQGRDDLADLVVSIAHAGIVAVDHAAEILLGPQGTRLARNGVSQVSGNLVAPHVDLLGLMRPDHVQVSLPHLIGEPLGKRIVGERFTVFLGHAVGCVRIPIVDVKEPIVLGGVVGEPLSHHRGNLFCGFHSAFAGIVNLVKAGVKLPGSVALSKGTDLGGVEAGVLELSWECVQFDPIPEIAAVSLDKRIRCGATVADHTAVDAEHPRVKRGARRQAGGVGGVAIGETDGLAGEGVNVWRGVAVVAVASEMVGTQGVDVDVEDAHGATDSSCSEFADSEPGRDSVRCRRRRRDR